MITLTTQCPECQMRFSVAGDELRRRKGLVRCIQCHEVFDGYEAVVSDRPSVDFLYDAGAQADEALLEHDIPFEHLSESPTDPFPEIPAELLNSPTAEPVFFIEATDEGVDSEPLISIDDAPDPHTTSTPPDMDPALFSSASPVYAERRIEPPEFSWRASLARLAWRLLLGLLVVGALLQVAYVYRAQIALHAPFMRPALQSLCAYAGCKVPYLRALSAIDITYSRLSLEGQSIDDARRQYLLQVGLHNTASVPQEWPTLLITFSDVSATVLARVVVTPEQYLNASQRNGPFLPRQVIDLRLQVEAEGTKINGFKVEKFFS